MKTAPITNPQRRHLLKAAQSAGLLAAVAALFGGRHAAATTAAAPVADPAPEAGGKRGYHETDHIRKYYATARYF